MYLPVHQVSWVRNAAFQLLFLILGSNYRVALIIRLQCLVWFKYKFYPFIEITSYITGKQQLNISHQCSFQL